MTGFIICLVMAAINIPFVLQGSIINTLAFLFCLGMGLFFLKHLNRFNK